MKNIAVILAGGSGNRFGADKPKQFLEVAGKTILEHSVLKFASHPLIDEVCVVCREEWIDYCGELLNGIAKVKHIVAGGKERYHSTLAALNIYQTSDCFLLIHDAVRPLVTQEIINACIESGADACAVGVPSTDTIWQAQDGIIQSIPERKTLYNAQTPQCFRQAILKKAFDRALNDPGFLPTDDCGVVRTYLPDVDIRIITGEPTNIKITYPANLELAERLLKSK